MARYGRSFSKDADWAFVTTRSPEALAPILAGYDQRLDRDEGSGGGIAHLLRVFLIDEAGFIAMRGRMLHDEHGRLELQAYGQRPHEVIHSVSRLMLTALLLDAAEATGGRVRIRFGRRCEAVDLARGTLTCDGSGGREDIPFESAKSQNRIDDDNVHRYLCPAVGRGARARRHVDRDQSSWKPGTFIATRAISSTSQKPLHPARISIDCLRRPPIPRAGQG